MFEFGRDLRRLFEKARDSDDLGWLELIGVGLVEIEARQQSVDAGRVSCGRPWDAWMRASALWREHFRRCGTPESLQKAQAAALDASRAAQNEDQTMRAAIEIGHAEMLAFDLYGDSRRIDEALQGLAGLSAPRRGETASLMAALHARLRARRARMSGQADDLMDAAHRLDAAVHGLRSTAAVSEELRLDRAALSLEAGLAARDPALLDQAGRELRQLVESAAPEQRPIARARALALCGTGMAALAAVAGDASARHQAHALFDAAADQFTPDHSPLDWAAVQVLRAEREPVPALVLAQAEALTQGSGLILGALAHERRVAADAERAGKRGDLTALLELEGELRRRLKQPGPNAGPADWASDQIGMAHVVLARNRWTGEAAPALGLMLVEAAAAAQEAGAPSLARTAERLLALSKG